MAGLADKTPAADILVLGPMARRHLARVDRNNERFRFLHVIQQDFHLFGMWREAAIEAHHDQRPDLSFCHLLVCDLNLQEFAQSETERLFDKHVLVGFQGLQDVIPICAA